MAEFTGTVVVVTGASEGIGRALCLGLAPQGPKLVLAARNAARLDELKSQCEAAGGQALSVPTDVTDEAACRALIERAVQEYGGIDVLVNNAGRTMWTTFEQVTDLSLYDQLMRLNYLGAVYCTYYALPHLKQSLGRIVGISSVAGLTGVPTRTGYSASKHAMFGFFDSLRVELRGTGVSVTMVAPDFVLSEVHRRAFGSDGQALEQSPMQENKIMTAEECSTLIIRAMARRERLLITSRRGKLGRLLRVFAPGLMDKIAAKAISERR
ncbi:MAG: SDR family oxidoreductase [Candidatus Hydrogenedentota bacterium]